MILMLNSIFEIGFKPNGVNLSESTSEFWSEDSELESVQNGINTSFSLFHTRISDVSKLSSRVIDNSKIRSLQSKSSVLHFWNIIEICFEDHLAITYINEVYKETTSSSEKGLAL